MRAVVVQTERLELRMWQPADADVLHGIIGDPVTMRAWPAPFERETAVRWIDLVVGDFAVNGTGRFALVLRDGGAVIGDAGLLQAVAADREILDLGYIVHHPYWRQGYGFEAASALVEYAFDVLSRPVVHAHMALDNPASMAVAEKLGMRRVTDFPWERDRGKMHRLYELTPAR